MIRIILAVVVVALAWASWSAFSSAVYAGNLSLAVASTTSSYVSYAHSHFDGRGGDHLWQININAMDAGKGRKLTEAETMTLRALVRLDDEWIRSGRAGDRLRAIRGK